MKRLLDRIASANGITARMAARVAAQLLPTITAGAYCYWRCLGKTSHCGGGNINPWTWMYYCNGIPTGTYKCEWDFDKRC
jgi:hypothetical protein